MSPLLHVARPRRKAGNSAKAVREDRTLAGAQATGGAPRRLTDLFRLSIEGANRCVDALEHLALSTAR